LFKVYDKEQPDVLPVEIPDFTQKTDEEDNNSEVFAQHFATRKNVIKSRHQGLVQGGEVVNQTKLFLFNHNTRRIVNLATLIVVQFIFICAKIYEDEINKSYPGPTIQNLLPLIIHVFIFLNTLYTYAMLLLQIADKRHDPSAKVEAEPDSSVQFNKSMYSQGLKRTEQKMATGQSNQSNLLSTTIPTTNKLIIKNNGLVTSLYDLKRPQIVRPEKMKRQRHKREVTNRIEEED
jgi:hypothetical protein